MPGPLSSEPPNIMRILHICITAIMASAPTFCHLTGNLWHKQLLPYSLNKYWWAATILGEEEEIGVIPGHRLSGSKIRPKFYDLGSGKNIPKM